MANLLKRVLPMGSADARLAQRVTDRFGMSERRFAGAHRKWREYNRLYLSLSPALANRLNDRPANEKRSRREDLFVPLPFSIIESAVARWMFGVFASRPYVTVYGRTLDDEEKSKSVEMMTDYDFDRAQVFLKAIPLAKSLYKYGTGIFKVTFRHDSYELKQKIPSQIVPELDPLTGEIVAGELPGRTESFTVERFHGPWFEAISPFNFFPDPDYFEPEEMRFVCERRWVDRETLRRKNDLHKELTGEDLYKNLDKIPRTRGDSVRYGEHVDPSDGTDEAMGWNSPGAHGISPGNYPSGPRGDRERDEDEMIEVIEYWEPNRIVEVAQGEVPIRDAENPFDDKAIPYGMVQCFTLEQESWGLGILQPNKKSFEELNSWRNLNMRQGKLNALSVWAMDESVTLKGPSFMLEPGSIAQVPFFANGKPAIVPLLPPRALPPESYQYEDRIVADIHRATAFNDPATGGGGQRGSDTATEAGILERATAMRIRMQTSVGEGQFLIRLAKMFFSRRQQFFRESEIFRILGKEGVEFKKLSPEDIAGEFDFVPTATHYGPNREVLRQQVLQGISLTNANPSLLQITNLYELWREFFKLADMRFPERYLVPPQLKTWDPRKENIVLDANEWIEVTPNENHEEHIRVHSSGIPTEMRLRHIEEHRKFLDVAKGAPAPQEQQGRVSGEASNVPNLEQALPSEGRLNAMVRG